MSMMSVDTWPYSRLGTALLKNSPQKRLNVPYFSWHCTLACASCPNKNKLLLVCFFPFHHSITFKSLQGDFPLQINFQILTIIRIIDVLFRTFCFWLNLTKSCFTFTTAACAHPQPGVIQTRCFFSLLLFILRLQTHLMHVLNGYK